MSAKAIDNACHTGAIQIILLGYHPNWMNLSRANINTNKKHKYQYLTTSSPTGHIVENNQFY
jgi:hypothetical protein